MTMKIRKKYDTKKNQLTFKKKGFLILKIVIKQNDRENNFKKQFLRKLSDALF